jgi:hypothetical protein
VKTFLSWTLAIVLILAVIALVFPAFAAWLIAVILANAVYVALGIGIFGLMVTAICSWRV